MDKKIELTIMATSVAIFFAILVEVWSKYSKLLLSIEVIVLPVVYYVGYEILMKQQKKDFSELLTVVQNRGNALEAKNIQLKTIVQNRGNALKAKIIQLKTEQKFLKKLIKFKNK